MKIWLCILLSGLVINTSAQSFTQTLRGSIIDKETRQPLVGASVLELNSGKGATTTLEGTFSIEEVPIGRISLKVSYIGYETLQLSNLELSAAKELVLEIELEESVIKGGTVVILAEEDKSKANNELATVSVRKFSVEETQRFAGARNDVSRMAANFAGVQASNDQANDIVIRGNSPNTLLWRLEGVDIPNPNHFGDYGSTGGPVSMLNNNVLSNSDFYTGAFPAGYGNSLSGVFDLKMRKGNSNGHEFMGQVGFNGFELGAEGPLSKSGASYLINGRYSTLELMQNMGINVGTGTAVPKYKDLTFKLFFPLSSQSTLSIFGLGGMSSIDFLNSERDSSEVGDLWSTSTLDIFDRTKMAVVGANHSKLIGSKAYLKTTIAFTTQLNSDVVDSVAPDSREVHEFYKQDYRNSKLFFHSYYNHKFDARNSLRVGLIVNHMLFSIKDSLYRNIRDEYLTLTNTEGNTQLSQLYANFSHRFTQNLSLKLGLNNQFLTLNGYNSLEPRAALEYVAGQRSVFTFGYGLHSHMSPLNFYFIEERLQDGSYVKPNEELQFAKSHHLVAGYGLAMPRNYHVKVEAYYQSIFNAVIGTRPSSTFSMINMSSFDFSAPDSLTNGGTGENYGLEITIEKFLTKGFYFLGTGSFFNSTYATKTGKAYNTKFNNNYVVNVLGGKEVMLPSKESAKYKKSIAFDMKATIAGGQRYTPINLEASKLANEAIYDTRNPYSEQFANYFRTDVRIAFRLSGKKVVQEWAFDVQNLTNQQNALFQRYNSATQEVETSYQLGIFPLMQYRIQF